MYSRRLYPFDELEAIRNQINHAFEPVMRTFTQEPHSSTFLHSFPLELTESTSHYTLQASLPGVDPNSIDVQATPKSLNLSFERPAPTTEKEDILHLSEIRYGKFRRTLEFGSPVVSDEIQAEYHQGVLTLTIPKEGAQKEKTVKVNIKTS